MMHDQTKHFSDKELGLMLNTLPDEVRRFIFPVRKYGDPTFWKSQEALYRAIRPTGNKLVGYTPSYAMHKIMEEDA